jgi:hypothetical protein
MDSAVWVSAGLLVQAPMFRTHRCGLQLRFTFVGGGFGRELYRETVLGGNELGKKLTHTHIRPQFALLADSRLRLLRAHLNGQNKHVALIEWAENTGYVVSAPMQHPLPQKCRIESDVAQGPCYVRTK